MSAKSIIEKAEAASEGVATLLLLKPRITQVSDGHYIPEESKASVRIEFDGPGCVEKMHRAYDALKAIIG